MSGNGMDSLSVKLILDKLPNEATIGEIDGAISWLNDHRRQLLLKWNADVYEWAGMAIDSLLDARMVAMRR